jgi:hypothetical protein
MGNSSSEEIARGLNAQRARLLSEQCIIGNEVDMAIIFLGVVVILGKFILLKRGDSLGVRDKQSPLMCLLRGRKA